MYIENDLIIEDAKLGFLNFAGKVGPFNPSGKRSFAVFFDKEVGLGLEKDGWGISWTKPREDDDEPKPFLRVAVSFDNIPPKIVLINPRSKIILDEKDVHMLDWVEIESVDLILNPYNWEFNGKTGVKAYLKSMYITKKEDAFEAKYEDIAYQTPVEPEFDGD